MTTSSNASPPDVVRPLVVPVASHSPKAIVQGRCATHASDVCVDEAPIARRVRRRRPSSLEATPQPPVSWSATHLWATNESGNYRFALRAGPSRSYGASFSMRHAIDEHGMPKAVLTSQKSFCAQGLCSRDRLFPPIPTAAASACESPVQAEFVGLDERGHKVWFTTSFDADVFHLLEELLSDDERLLVIYRVLDSSLHALRRLHASGFGHGDVKPENLFWNAKGDIALGDFEFAFLVDDTPSSLLDRFAGTYNFCSPEAFKLEKSERALKGDVFSLGLSALELISPQNFLQFVALESNAQNVSEFPERERRFARERHSMLGARIALAQGQSIPLSAMHKRFGTRWHGLDQAVRDMTAIDERLAHFILFGMLPIEANERQSAEALSTDLQTLIATSEPLLRAIRPKEPSPHGHEGPIDPTVRRTWFDASCAQLFAELSFDAEASILARSDVSQLQFYASHPKGSALTTIGASTWKFWPTREQQAARSSTLPVQFPWSWFHVPFPTLMARTQSLLPNPLRWWPAQRLWERGPWFLPTLPQWAPEWLGGRRHPARLT